MAGLDKFAGINALSGARCAVLVAALAGMMLCSMARAQDAAAQTGGGDGSAIQVPAASTADSLPSASDTGSGSGSGWAARTDQPAINSSSSSGSGSAPDWSRSMLDPFQPGPNFGNFSGTPGSGMNAGGNGGPGRGRRGMSQDGSAMSGFGMGGAGRGGAGMGGPVFPASDGPARGSYSALPTLPSLNQMMRGSYMLPLNSGASRLRFNFQDQMRPGANLNDLTRPTASAMFSTSDLGNGMFLSAGTSYGRMNAGAPAAGLGSNLSGEGKHSGPSLAIKLSF